MTREGLERYLHSHIPLAVAMDVRASEVQDGLVRLVAPLAPNVNHRGTAFGGSIAALAVLAGWGWLRARLDGHSPVPRLVVQRQVVDYLLAATGELVATCRAPPAEEWRRFERLLQRRGRARLDLAVEVDSAGVRVATFAGVYAAAIGDAPGDAG